MPSRKRRHMASFKGMMMAHAPVVTDERTSGGWIGWMPAKIIPATKAARPAQRMSFEAVGFMVLSFPSVDIFRSSLSTPAAIPSVLAFSVVAVFRTPHYLMFVVGSLRLGGFEANGRDQG